MRKMTSISGNSGLHGRVVLSLAVAFAANLSFTVDAANRYFFSWAPETLVAYPGDSLRLELMLENDDTIKSYGFRCLVSSDVLFDSVAADWHGGEEETTAAEAGNITMFGFGWLPGEFGGYAYTLRCDPGAPPGTHVAAYFHSWVSEEAQAGNYTIVFPYNHDFLRCDASEVDAPGDTGVVRIPEGFLGDVGPISITSPPRYVYEGTGYVPEARIKNFGAEAVDSVRIFCNIDTSGIEIYADTALISHLAGFGVRDVSFAEWTVPRAYVDYDVMIASFHSEDPRGVNDTLVSQVLGVIPGDVGVVMITNPPESVYVDSIYYPCAMVTNYSSDSARGFTVACELRFEDITWWTSTRQLAGLAGNDTTSVTFDCWVVQFEEDYEVIAYTLYAADENCANDTVTAAVYGVFPPGDISPVSVVNPPDTVYADSTYRPSAKIQNATRDETGVFLVHCEIDSAGVVVWTDVAEDSGLGGSDTLTVGFSDWVVPAKGIYNFTVFTVYSYDTIPSNDTILTTVSAVDAVGLTEEFGERWSPSGYAILGVYPNPMSGKAEVFYQVPNTSQVTLTIYDAMGRRVRKLLEETREPGYHQAEWDGRTEDGSEAPSGMYFCRISAGDFSSMKKIVLLR